MDKRSFILGLLFSVLTVLCNAQVSMTLQVSPTGNLVKNQLWNMVLVNSSTSGILLTVNLVLMDVNTNQPVLTATTAPVNLAAGAKQLSANDLGPIRYVYNMAGPGADRDPNGLLPAGIYQACYSVAVVGKNIVLVENCIQLNVDPLSPPLLNTPANEERNAAPYPQFTWLPPTPLGMFSDLNYDIIVVEVLKGQGKADAIQQNIPVYSTGHLNTLYSIYPSSIRALDTSKLYAWRIIARNGRQPVAMSDVWTFRVMPTAIAEILKKESPYVNVARGQDAAIVSAGNALRISYENAAADTSIHYTINNLNDPGNPEVQRGDIPVRYGRNLLDVALQKKNGFAAHKLYQFTFVNSRNETWSVKFTY